MTASSSPASPKFTLPLVYPITDKKLSGRDTHLSVIRELVRGGARLVQVRDKNTPARELLPDLKRCADFCEKNGIVLIVDDRCDLALGCRAAGVHLGQQDLPPRAARKILGADWIIGFSTHDLAQVRGARNLPIQYVGFGPVYATATKSDPDSVTGISGLRRACQVSRHPVVAIGGIGPAQIGEVLGAGAASAAVVSNLMTAPDPARQMELLLSRALSWATRAGGFGEEHPRNSRRS